MSPFLPLIVITIIWPPPTASQCGSKKTIGEPSSDAFSTCGGIRPWVEWAAVKPENTFKNHNFGSDTDTYELNWASVVPWPGCVNKLQLWVNNGWQEPQDVNTQNPLIYQVTMPTCNQVTKYNLKMEISFPFANSRDQCLEIDLGWFSHKIQTLADFFNLKRNTESELNGENVKIFWLRNILKNEKCLDRVELTTNGDTSKVQVITPIEERYGKRYERYFELPRMCNTQIATVTYYFKASFPPHSKEIAVPKSESACKETYEQENTAKLPKIIKEKPTNSTIYNKKKESKNLKTTVIIVTSVAVVSTLSFVLVLAICLDQKKKRSARTPPGQMDEQGHGHLNELYGTYYNGQPQYSTVEDTNAYYGVGDD